MASKIIVGDNLDQIDPVEMREDSDGELWSPAESEPIAVLNCRRSRHNRPHSPIRMMIRSRRPSWQIFCRRGGGRQNPATAAQIAQKPHG